MRAGWWLLAGLLLAPATVQAADPSILWKIVNGSCVPHQQETGDPAPCSLVDLQHGFSLLKDINGVAQFLLIPTQRIGGIEDPGILAAGVPNFWDAAWRNRGLVEARLHAALPREAMSLAINSSVGRTQDQFHIHIDCVRPDVRDAIAAHIDAIGPSWSPFPVPLAGHSYRAMRIGQESLDGIDPFRLLVDADAKAREDLGLHTLVLVGATFPDGAKGFVLFDDRANLMAGDRASGEQLQDHTCAISQR